MSPGTAETTETFRGLLTLNCELVAIVEGGRKAPGGSLREFSESIRSLYSG